jgi:hypothetical protein
MEIAEVRGMSGVEPSISDATMLVSHNEILCVRRSWTGH